MIILMCECILLSVDEEDDYDDYDDDDEEDDMIEYEVAPSEDEDEEEKGMKKFIGNMNIFILLNRRK
jgi:hypothetical protein